MTFKGVDVTVINRMGMIESSGLSKQYVTFRRTSVNQILAFNVLNTKIQWNISNQTHPDRNKNVDYRGFRIRRVSVCIPAVASALLYLVLNMYKISTVQMSVKLQKPFNGLYQTREGGNHAPDIFDLEFFIGIAFPPIINDPDFVKALEHFIKGDNAPSRSFIEECSWMYYLFYDPVGTTEHTVTLQVILIRLVSMAILLDKAAKVKYLTRPGRNRGICIKVFLLSNEGAHAYNGNGAFFGRPRRQEYIPLMEHDETEPASGFEVNRIVVFKPTYIYCNTHPEVTTKFVDACTQYDIKEPSGNPNLSVDTLQRSPSDKDIGTIALNIGPEWHSLGLQLGLSEVELYQIREDNRENCVQRNSAMLFRWRRNKENCATFEELCNACIRINANPDNILKNIEEA